MVTSLFCPTCGADLKPFETKTYCECGFTSNISELKSSQSYLYSFNKEDFFSNEYYKNVNSSLNNLSRLKLDSTYFFASSAKKDFMRKINYIQENVIPSLNIYKDALNYSENDVTEHRNRIGEKIYKISSIAINDFIGPLSVKSLKKEYESYRDFSIYKFDLRNTYSNDEIQLLSNYSFDKVVSSTFNNSIDTFMNSGALKKANKENRELNEDDLKMAGLEAGISAVTDIVGGIFNGIDENFENIKTIRLKDKEIVLEIENLYNSTEDLKIEESEIINRKRTLIIEESVLDYCYKVSLKPLLDNFFNEDIFIEYKENQYYHELNSIKIKHELNILKENNLVSFWKALFSSKIDLFNILWNQKKTQYKEINNYYSIIADLGEQNHHSLDQLLLSHSTLINEYKNYEKHYRNLFRDNESYKKAQPFVEKFINVLKRIKENLNN